MLRYYIKLWTSNSAAVFKIASQLFAEQRIDGIELYNNPALEIDWEKLAVVRSIPVSIHNTHSHGWHEFNLKEEQLAMWRTSLQLADYFKSSSIVVHPGRAASLVAFRSNLNKINDPRILLENMAGLDIHGQDVFANDLTVLQELKELYPICFDFEKAVKAAKRYHLDYQVFISDALKALQPNYFHLSGGDKNSPIDEHTNLWEANFDIAWIRSLLMARAKIDDLIVVFETPKDQDGLENDLKNIAFFKGVI